MKHPLDVTVEPTPRSPGEVGVTYHARQGTTDRGSIHFVASSTAVDVFRPGVRTAVLAWLLPAMRLGVPLRVDAPLDATSHANLRLWQEAMARWRPESLSVVPIHAPVATPEEAPVRGADRALAAFSGGVDSCHTLWRHGIRDTPAGLRLAAGLLVHGLDVDAEDEPGFATATARARGILEPHGVRLLTLRTDIRRLERSFGLDWEVEAHGLMLAACLACFETAFDAVLIPGTYPLHRLVLPWGSNPVTDPLFTGCIPWLHDGASSTKLDKVLDFATDVPIRNHVRVCWQGDAADGNCGRCFKCLTTQACYWLAGVARPPAFDHPASVADLARIPVKNAVNHLLVDDLRHYAVEVDRPDIASEIRHSLRRATWLSKKGPRWRAALWRSAGSVLPLQLARTLAQRSLAGRESP